MYIRYKKLYSSQHGVALIQVLLLTGIIMILVLQITNESQSQVKMAQRWQDKTNLELQLNDTQEQILFDLLVQDRVPSSASEVTQKWNFYGKPFSFGANVVVTIQDQAGLLSVMYSGADIETYLKTSGVSPLQAESWVGALNEWQGMGNNTNSVMTVGKGPIQFYSELSFVSGYDEIRLPQSVLSLLPVSYFNPATSPQNLLAGILSNDSLDGFVAMREAGTLTQTALNALPGLSRDEPLVLEPSELVTINIAVKSSTMNIKNRTTVRLQVDRTPPFVFLSE